MERERLQEKTTPNNAPSYCSSKGTSTRHYAVHGVVVFRRDAAGGGNAVNTLNNPSPLKTCQRARHHRCLGAHGASMFFRVSTTVLLFDLFIFDCRFRRGFVNPC